LEVAESSKTWRGDLACSLVYDRRSSTVLGAQIAGKSIAAFAESLPLIVAARMTLKQLAYSETLTSTDISPIRETAREAALKK
jgi:pyruvate/2-oxoglutarate dehydrogenase complex dihydrolipoamide dehydrogenase (E3) component